MPSPLTHATSLADDPSQPTNHLDIEGLDALISAITGWNGGVIVISHDERSITSVAKELWVCADGQAYQFKGDVQAYKVGLLCASLGCAEANEVCRVSL